MNVRVRFAPSPTGHLHIGNARAALMNWLFARQQGGAFMLRIDDTDAERSREAYITGIQDDLKWLGLEWDEFAQQSTRMEAYEAARDQLIASGKLYPCYETSEELDLKRKSLLARGKPPIYDREGLSLSDEDRQKYESEGRHPHWRFRLDDEPIVLKDLIRGSVRFEASSLSDPVLIRADGSFLYTLCSVVDDIAFKITHVIRGEDHVANTAVHTHIFRALGAKAPEFAHYALLASAKGDKFSKRSGGLSLGDLRTTEGFEPMAVLSVLARLGTSSPIEPFMELNDLIADFDFAKFSRTAAKFDLSEVQRINGRLLLSTPFTDVQERLAAINVHEEPFWLAIRENISRLAEAADWHEIVAGPILPLPDDVKLPDVTFLQEALAHLPEDPWGPETWKIWTKALSQATNLKGKDLFMPLRRALTGRDHGPDLTHILPLIGREQTIERLNSAPWS